jgi:RNA polymerase sigma-70 factor (ECF subfamily)
MERIASLKAYLYTTVKHKSLNFLQKQFRRRGDMTLENITSDVEDTKIPPPDELLGNKELVTILQDALKSLPPGCRQIFSMKRFGGLSNKEIADMLQISVKTVEAQMTIALKKLSVFISANWETLVFFFTVSFLEFL